MKKNPLPDPMRSLTAVVIVLGTALAAAAEPGSSLPMRQDRSVPVFSTRPVIEPADPDPQGQLVAASRRWRPSEWPARLSAQSAGGSVSGRLPGFEAPPDLPAVTSRPVGLLLQREISGAQSHAKLARLGAGYQPLPEITVEEPGYRVVAANLLDDGSGRVLWYRQDASTTYVRLWRTNGSFTKPTNVDLTISREWIPVAHSQKYASGMGYIAFRRDASGAAKNETFVWHLNSSDQVVGGTWIPQQGAGAWAPSGFALVGRGGRLLFTSTTDTNPPPQYLSHCTWIVNDQVQLMGAQGFECYGTNLWGAGTLSTDWAATSSTDNEIFFTRRTSPANEGLLRFFNRLNDIPSGISNSALSTYDITYAAASGYEFAGYTRTAANYHVPSPGQQALLTQLRTHGCGVSNLLTGGGGGALFNDAIFDIEAATLARSECRSFLMEFIPWGVLADFPFAAARKQNIESRTSASLQFSFYLAEVVDQNKEWCQAGGQCHSFGDMCYVDAQGNRLYPYENPLSQPPPHMCVPDLRNAQYQAYATDMFVQAIENGFTNFIFGGVWFQDPLAWSYQETVIPDLVAALRQEAQNRGITVLIGGAYDGLSLESETAFDYVWHITNTAYQAPNASGYMELVDGRPCHPIAAGNRYCPGLAWHYKYYSVVPTVSIIDVGGWGDEIHGFAGLGYSSSQPAAERARRRACSLKSAFATHRSDAGRRAYTGYAPAMVNLLIEGSRGYGAAPPTDFPAINCFGPTRDQIAPPPWPPAPQEFLYSASHDYTHANACGDEDVINGLFREDDLALDCTTVVGPAARDAALVRQAIPPRMIAGQPYFPGAAFRNSGAAIWSANHPVRPTLMPTGANPWNGVAQPLSPPLDPGEARTLLSSVTAPATAGGYPLQLRLFDTATSQWFGPATSSTTVSVTPADPNYEARFVSQDVPLRMQAGAHYAVRVRFKNVGGQPWNDFGAHCGAFRLGPTTPTNPWGLERGEITLPVPPGVPPGDEVVIELPVVAPATPDTYAFQWRLLRECQFWFGDWTPSVPVTVTSGPVPEPSE